MTKEENFTIPRWFLERIEDTLRIQYNINLDKKTGETCQDRNVKEALNGVRKLLKGEELTGGERLEKLQPSLPSDLDEAAEEWCKMNNKGIALSADKKSHYLAEGKDAFKAGAEWLKEITRPEKVKDSDLNDNGKLSAKIGSSGYDAKIDSTGEDSVICCAGHNSRVRAKLGSWITLAEWAKDKKKGRWVPKMVKTIQIDGKTYKPDTWYKLENGEIKEAE